MHIGQTEIATGVAEGQPFVIHAHLMQHGGVQVMHLHRILGAVVLLIGTVALRAVLLQDGLNVAGEIHRLTSGSSSARKNSPHADEGAELRERASPTTGCG